jgi:hypothetical protein
MKKIHILPTSKPSRLLLSGFGALFLTPPMEFKNSDTYQNIYITNDSEIKEGDYGIGFAHGIKGVGRHYYVFKHDGSNRGKLNAICEGAKKIILTTDQDLIKNGVQAIDDDFLEWFVKNSSCEEVEVKHFGTCCGNQLIAQCINCKKYNPVYKIIIPKEEPKDVVLGYKTSLDAQMLDSQYVDFSNPNADKITSTSTTTIKEEPKQETSKVTRVEVIQHSPPYNGRAYTNYNAKDVEIQFQDDNTTLKIFLK